MQSVIFRKGSGGLLNKAFKYFLKHFKEEYLIAKHKDDSGIYAYETRNFYLCARRYIWNNNGKKIISVHSQVLYNAWAKGKKIAVYVDNEKMIMIFHPEKLIGKTFENIRGNILMVNFEVNNSETFINVGD